MVLIPELLLIYNIRINMTACACGRVCVCTRVYRRKCVLLVCCRIGETGKEYGYITRTFYINNLPGRGWPCVCLCPAVLCLCVLVCPWLLCLLPGVQLNAYYTFACILYTTCNNCINFLCFAVFSGIYAVYLCFVRLLYAPYIASVYNYVLQYMRYCCII
jgi:hypothetical protein